MDRKELFRSTTPFFDAVAHTAQACWGYGRALKQAVAHELLAADYDSDDALRERLQRADAFLEPFKPHCIGDGEIIDNLLAPLWTKHPSAFERPRSAPTTQKLYPSKSAMRQIDVDASFPFFHWSQVVEDIDIPDEYLSWHPHAECGDKHTTVVRFSEPSQNKEYFRAFCGKCRLIVGGGIAKAKIRRPVGHAIKTFRQQKDSNNDAYSKARDYYWHIKEKEKEKQRSIEREQRRAEYHKYLQSDQWRQKRAAVMRRASGICEGCQRARAVEVHHKTYENIFNEPLWDLVASCEACHRSVHGHAAH